jgi:hypothetical protein
MTDGWRDFPSTGWHNYTVVCVADIDAGRGDPQAERRCGPRGRGTGHRAGGDLHPGGGPDEYTDTDAFTEPDQWIRLPGLSNGRA